MKKWYAVIGDPIAQSMSPAMHDAWFIENELDASYIPIRVAPNDLGQAIDSLKRLGCAGWNVTIPHKTAIIPYLDHLEPSAKLMNAVNTVHVQSDGSLIGSNTDGQGFVRSLLEAYGDTCKNGRVLIIGAGGAARGIAYALHAAGFGPIVFTNRTVENAEQLASGIDGATILSIGDAELKLTDFQLIVQTTSVGMNFGIQGMPLSLENVARDVVVADIIYNPLETVFLAEARNRNAKTLNGVGMFIHQGALAFEKWTGVQPNTEKMINKITLILGGKSC